MHSQHKKYINGRPQRQCNKEQEQQELKATWRTATARTTTLQCKREEQPKGRKTPSCKLAIIGVGQSQILNCTCWRLIFPGENWQYRIQCLDRCHCSHNERPKLQQSSSLWQPWPVLKLDSKPPHRWNPYACSSSAPPLQAPHVFFLYVRCTWETAAVTASCQTPLLNAPNPDRDTIFVPSSTLVFHQDLWNSSPSWDSDPTGHRLPKNSPPVNLEKGVQSGFSGVNSWPSYCRGPTTRS